MGCNEFRGVLLTAVLLLGGCTSLYHPVAIDWEHGTRRGTVTRLYGAASSVGDLPPCLATLSATDLRRQQYVEIDYRHVRHMFREIAPMPDGMTLSPGDTVEFKPGNCHNGVLSTMLRVLPDAPT